MQEELKNLLTNLDYAEFSELVHSVSMAFNTRTKMKEHQITIEALAEKTRLSYEEIFNFLCGIHTYGFNIITKIDLGLNEIVDKKKGNVTLEDIFKREEKDESEKLSKESKSLSEAR